MKPQEIEFTQTKNIFSMTCTVKAKINAEAESIWNLLTDAKRFPNWNSTISAIDGNIAEGERICIHVPGTSRTFKPKVSDVVDKQSMIWSNGLSKIFRGARSFELRQCANGATEFIMEEEFSGVLFAVVKNKLPDFKLIFEKYANDLKKEAERLKPSIN